MDSKLKKRLVKKALPRALYKPLIERMRRRDADYIVVSFPKSGRTWLRFMLSLYFSRQCGVPAENLFKFDTLDVLDSHVPKIHFTHDDEYKSGPTRLKRSKSFYYSKNVLFLLRDPRDIVVSLYFHRVYRDRDLSGSLGEFIFGKEGGVETLLEFYNIWAANFDHISSKLLLKYEDMRKDPAQGLERVLNFLGVPVEHDTVEYAVNQSSFSNMRRFELDGTFSSEALRPGDSSKEESFKVRRGKVGGYRDYLTEEEIERIDQLIATRLDRVFGY